MRSFSLAMLTGVAVAALHVPVSAEPAYTTRIEPRPFYGATVTLEEGVRVFRPLPPHNRVIIDPRNQTTIYLDSIDIDRPHRRYSGRSRGAEEGR
jgi:hypothetical protein